MFRSPGQRVARIAGVLVSTVWLAAGCGGGGGSSSSGGSASQQAAAQVDTAGNPYPTTIDVGQPDRPTSEKDATRLLQQATFGPNAALVDAVKAKGARKYLLEQFAEPASRYVYTLPANAWRDQVHTSGQQDFCAAQGGNVDACWRDWYTSVPLEWDFFRQAVANRDQLRQRIAFSLGQIFVTSGKDLGGAYGFAEYHQMLRDGAFDNFRTILQNVTLSPFMGQYLNMVNNDADDPNENYARELLQLFSIGTCRLNIDGTVAGGKCLATYDNATVREYAFALTGWTYPRGGVDPWCSGCNTWTNPEYFRGPMVPVASRHDTQERTLLSGVKAPANRTPQQGLQSVLDSIIAHPNVGPFIGRQLIQFLVTSNPSPAYVGRVAAAFNAGRFNDAYGGIGTGVKGDMKATIAAILLDEEARDVSYAAGATYGKLREPVVMMVGAIRAFDGVSDGERLGLWGQARDLGQPLFNADSVFNFYPPDYPVSGTALVAPQFGIENANTTLARFNFANSLVYWWYNRGEGLPPNPVVTAATGTRLDYARLEALINDPAADSIKVVDRLDTLLVDGRLGAADKQAIVAAMNEWKSTDTWLGQDNIRSNWKRERVKTAAYLILSSPHYQVQR